MGRYRWRAAWDMARPSASRCRWRRLGFHATPSRWAEMSEPMEMPNPTPSSESSDAASDPRESAMPAEPAKLKIYLGAAPGVGKTYQMLEDAHLMRRRGIDVVIALV